jgi:hypothetical protein
MAKSKRPNKAVAKTHDVQRRKLTYELHKVGANTGLAIARLKSTASPDHLFSQFPHLFPDRHALDNIYGPALPATLSSLFSISPKYGPSGPITEIVWSICRCLQYGTELRSFVNLRARFECSLLRDTKEDCISILDAIQRDFGYSLWLMENRLSTTQTWAGIDEARKLKRSFDEELSGNWLAQLLLSFISRRIEATGVKDHLKSELTRLLHDSANPSLESYLRAKLFELSDILTADVPATLLFEGHAGIIDLYETLVAILQSAASEQAIPDALVHSLEKPLLTLFKRTDDQRLPGVLRGLGIHGGEFTPGPDNRIKLIEGYSKGDYQSVSDGAQSYLETTPDDMAIQVLQLRANLHMGLAKVNATGLLGDISERLYKVLTFGPDTYSSAYQLLLIFDRYYSHSWAQYMRVVLWHELRKEENSFPPLWLRDIYVRDPYTTPFSAIGASRKIRLEISSNADLRSTFPNTWAVYDLVTSGETKTPTIIETTRKHCYLARHHLAFGDPNVALNHFNWLVAHTKGESQLRAAGGTALANLVLGNVQEAAQSIVTAVVRNPDVPSVLPIEAVAKALDDPKVWPNSLVIPLLFELYVTYCDDERLPHLRYAFECFLAGNSIGVPDDLVSRIDDFGRKEVVEFLRRVWRPEIMRQTVIYHGTREIEETRIRVCQLLAEMDPENAPEYLEEIKERVKELEIARATTLMEQSKVYVDIEAIRRAIRGKLADSYARYKNAAQATNIKTDDVFKKFTQVVAKGADQSVASLPVLLSKLHILDGITDSEADVQFQALFSEVTNEFLLGAHGLNAYLSTRIRHGTLLNTLRKPVADDQLVTSRVEGKATYVRNQYWKNFQQLDQEHSKQWEEILNALDIFSSEFDTVLEHTRDKLLQIKVIHELKGASESSEALFVYQSSNVERRFVQQLDREATNLDDFVTQCLNILWEKTDENLANVQHVLDTTIRERLMAPFTTLTNRIDAVSTGMSAVGELLNAIARARTATQAKLGLVISWFKRNEVYDRQDYAPEFAFNIALHMVKNTISAAASWNRISVKSNVLISSMPGRTLDGMVYVFYGLLENAILRSGLTADQLQLDAEIILSEGSFFARVSNPVSQDKLTDAEKEKVERLRDSIRRNESGRAQLETRSGLHKIWLTINSPVYKEPRLDFFYRDATFVVELDFKLEVFDAECAHH